MSKSYFIYIKEGEYCTATQYGPISDADGFSGGYATLEAAIAALTGLLGAELDDIDLSRVPAAEVQAWRAGGA
jgi:hypothetical protein